MEKQKKGSKGLLVGILAAVVVLAVVLALVLTQCTGGAGTGATTAPSAARGDESASYKMYWNLDRAAYDGQSEAGMSSRPMGSDGYFSVRLFCDGQELELKTADRKIINKLDTLSLLSVILDADGVITEVLTVDELPIAVTGWGFYVQSVGGNTVKVNSSASFAGMEMLLDASNAKIYDMTGMSGKVGAEAVPMTSDRVYPIWNADGTLTHLFLYDRTNYMLEHEAECQHCKEKVTWSEWTREDAFPDKSGHYQLMTDIQLPGQQSFANDVKICLDLNGHTVTGKENSRLISLHNPGTSFALMDTSEAQTGKLVGHSTSSPQGGIVWVRYGQFHMYAGTLDGSDMVSRLNGTVVQVPKNAFFYMYGGEIIGGTAQPQRVETASSGYGYGIAGSVQVAGTMRMYGGTIRDGKAPAVYYKNSKGVLTLARGMGGNIFLASGAVMEIHDGQILNGRAGNVGGNIMMDGTAQLIIKGGKIDGGKIDGRLANKHGANIYCPSKGTIEMSGGSVSFGRSPTGGGGNIYLAGTMNLSGGSISGGWAGTTGGNILMVSKAQLYMSGGVIFAGKANGQVAGCGGGNIALTGDKTKLTLVGGIIRDGSAVGLVNEDGTTLGGDGGNINLNRGNLTCRGGAIIGGKATGNGGGIYIGWNSVGLKLSQKTRIYDNEVTDICRSGNTAAGKSQFLLGAWEGNGDKAAPVVDRLNGIAGSTVITPREETAFTDADVAKFTSAKRVLPLELNEKGNIVFAKPYLGEPDHIHCLCTGDADHTCTDTGFVSVDADMFAQCWSIGTSANSLMGSLNMCLTEDVTISTECAMSGNVLNLCLHGHTITMEGDARLTANGTTGVLNITDCTGSGKVLASEGCRSSFLYTYKGDINIYGGTVDGSDLGEGLGACRVGYAGDTFTLYGGTVIGSGSATAGGSFYCSVGGTINIKGGTVRNGVSTKEGGGNIFVNHNDAVLNISGGTITGGKANNTAQGYGLGGNIHVVRGALNISGGTITAGSAKGIAAAGEPAGVMGGVYVAYNAGKFTLGGNAKIYGNTGSDIWLTSKAGYVVTLDQWNGNGSKGALVIGKTAATAGAALVSGDVSKDDVALFGSGLDGLVLKHKGGKIILATPFVHDHCICRGTLEHTCQNVSFIEVTDAEDFKSLFSSNGELLESMDIALSGSFSLESEYKTNGHVLNICLNGNTITMKGKGRLTANGHGELNITDCGNGKIAAAVGCQQSFLYTYNGNLNLYAGTVDASAIVQSTASSGGKSGGAVTVYQPADRFHMYGGTIIGATIYRGGCVYAYKGTVTLHDGTIRDGYANVGGNVATDYGTFSMLGGTITGGTAETNGAAVFLGYQSKTAMTLSGDAAIYGNEGANDIYCGQNTGYKVNHLILDGWNGNGTHDPICIDRRDAAEGGLMVMTREGSLNKAMLQNFTYPDEELRLVLSEGRIVLAGYHRHCICNGKLSDHTCTEVTFTDVATAEEFKALFNSDGTLKESVSIVLTGSFTLDAKYTTNGNDLNICLNGNTITMDGEGRITANGGAGALSITDCGNGKIKAAATGTNAFVYAQNTELNLYGGTLDASAIEREMVDGAGNGGAVYVNTASASFHMYGGTVKGGKLYRGGAVYVHQGTFTMLGGTITGGRADLGGNVAVNQGNFLMKGGVITGGTAQTNGGGVHMGYGSKNSLVLSGDAAIYGNEGAEDLYLGLSTAAKNVLILDGWKGNGDNDAMILGSRNAGAGAVMVAAKEGSLDGTLLNQFDYPGDELRLVLTDGKYVLEKTLYHEHCLCNGALAHTCKKLRFTKVSTTEEFVALFDDGGLLKKSVSVYLAGDIELDKEYLTNGHVLDLCLGGYTITMNGNGRLTANGTTGDLNITDCGKGKILAASGARHSFVYAHNADVNLYNGTLDASAIKLSVTGSAFGGAVYANEAGATFTMYDGKIVGGQLARGGAAFAQNGAIVIRGGELTGGYADNGGAVFVSFGTFEMTGGTITGNRAKTNAAGVYLGYNMTTKPILGGNAAIYGNEGREDVWLGQNAAANNCIVLDGWTGDHVMTVGSRSAKDGAVVAEAKTGTVSETQLGFLASYNEAYVLQLNADGQVALKKLHRHCLCNGKVSGSDTHTCSTLTFAEVGTTDAFKALFTEDRKLKESVSICLTGNVELDNEYAVSGKTLDLCLNGHTITMTGNGRLTANATGLLSITDCGSGKIEAATGARQSFLYTYNGDIDLYGGTIDASKVSKSGNNGGAVYISEKADVFTMYGGIVKAAASANFGGAVYVNKGKLVINNGTIYGGSVKRGGAVFAQEAAAVFEMNGGLISGGSAEYGGCVGCNFAKFTMTGGKITGGSASITGAGVNIHYNVSVTVDISGTASITGNNGADIHLGQKSNQFITVAADWVGNGETPMILSRGTETVGAAIVAPKAGQTLAEGVLAQFAYLEGEFKLALSGGKVVLEK